MMVLNREKRTNKQLILRKGWSVFIFTVLVFSTMVVLVDVKSAEGISDTYSEDFMTTTYMDSVNTTVAAWGSGIINLPLKMTHTGSYDTPGQATSVFVSGDYAYVADGTSGLRIVNITDPTNPTSAGFYDSPGQATSVFISGDYAYVADGTSGLRIVNITDPTNPTSAGFYSSPGSTVDVFVSGNYAFVATEQLSTGFQVVNISDPTNPTLAGSSIIAGARGVFIEGDYAYITDSYAGALCVVNISDPTNPTSAGFYDTSDQPRGVFVSGDYAYVADSLSGLRIVNISDPTNPTSAGFYDTPGNAVGVFVSGDYAYVADSLSGLRIVNISDPTNPTSAGFYDTPGNAVGVFVSGDYAYVADGTSGLQVVEVMTNQFESLAVAQSLTVFSGSSSESLVSATLVSFVFVSLDTSIAYYLSADNGSHWEQVIPGLEHSFTNTGNQLKWKTVLTTSDLSKTPIISSLSIGYNTVTEEEKGFPWFWLGVSLAVVAVGIGAAILYFKKR